MSAPSATEAPSSFTPPVPAQVEQPALKSRMSAGVRGLLFASPLLLTVAVTFAGIAAMGWLSTTPAAPYGKEAENRYLALYNPHPTAADDGPNGEALYRKHCAECHGANGERNPAAPHVPEPRYIGGEGFKFTDTVSGAKQFRDTAQTLGGTPSDDRLLWLLRRGVKGSAMPSFDHLPEADLRAIVGYLRQRFITPERVLQRIGRAKELVAAKQNEGTGEEWDPKVDWNEAKRLPFRADAAADVFASQPVSVSDSLSTPRAGFAARASALFEKNCSGCHGKDGRGVIDPKYRNDSGSQAYPRNFASGVFKGGDTPADLYSRIYLGIPGTPMKAFGKELTQEEIADLVHHVKSFALPPAPTD